MMLVWKSALKFFLVIFFMGLTTLVAQGAASDRFSGWAWSSNIGWISMNCSNTGYCGTVDYGVTLASDDTTLTGWAWSPNLGWVDFSGVSYDETNGELSGRAQIVSGESDADGFDGYIRFKNTGSVAYGAVLDASDDIFDGYAWGDTVVGWVTMSCQTRGTCGTVDYGVLLQPFYFEMTASQGLSADDAVTYGGNFTITWTTDGADFCTASGGERNWTDIPVKAAGEPSPASFTVTGVENSAAYTLTCENSIGKQIARTLFINVNPPFPTLTLDALDTNVAFNTPTTLIWTALNVDTCTANGAWSGNKSSGTDRTQSSGSLTAAQNTFQLTCTSPYPALYSPAVDAVTVFVEKLILDFYADTVTVPFNDPVELTWETEFATGGCVASGNAFWTGPKASTDGTHTESVGPLDPANYTFTLTCNGTNGQQEIRTVNLKVGNNPDFTERIGEDDN